MLVHVYLFIWVVWTDFELVFVFKWQIIQRLQFYPGLLCSVWSDSFCFPFQVLLVYGLAFMVILPVVVVREHVPTLPFFPFIPSLFHHIYPLLHVFSPHLRAHGGTAPSVTVETRSSSTPPSSLCISCTRRQIWTWSVSILLTLKDHKLNSHTPSMKYSECWCDYYVWGSGEIMSSGLMFQD